MDTPAPLRAPPPEMGRWLALLGLLAGIIIVYLVILTLLKRTFARVRARPDGTGAEKLRGIERSLHGALVLAALAGAVVGGLWAMGVGREQVVDPALAWLQEKGLRIAVIVFLVLVARRVLGFLVARFSANIARLEGRVGQEARLRTLAQFLHGAGTAVIGVVGAFLVLETVLESVGTVLASVGFLGIALGFGAQALVRDLISGFFILLENQLAIGDATRINDLWGRVERIGLRSITLRDAEGIAHIVPNGTITRISNATREWSRAVVHAGADYSADPEKVLSALRAAAREVRGDPRRAADILGEPEVEGPESFEDGILYRISARTPPGRQWEVMRALRLSIWKAFAREGIPLKKSPLHSAAGKVE